MSFDEAMSFDIRGSFAVVTVRPTVVTILLSTVLHERLNLRNCPGAFLIRDTDTDTVRYMTVVHNSFHLVMDVQFELQI